MGISDTRLAPSVTEISDDCCPINYSFCTLVTKPDEYRNMVRLFIEKGFTEKDCEYLYIDNSRSNKYDAYSGYNRFLQYARGKYIILCHQDIEPIEHDRARLDGLLTAIGLSDPAWALCGNAGADRAGKNVVRISDPGGMNRSDGGPFPAPVMSLDENFIVVKRDANLALSRDLKGYHWYGSDLCIIADILGWHSYVIDFHLKHKSGGNKDAQFGETKRALKQKLTRAFRSRWHFVVTREPIYISGSRYRQVIAEVPREIKKWLGRIVRKLIKL